MTTEEYRTAIAKLGLTISGARLALGISPRQAQRLHAGDCPIPGPVSKLLRLAIRLKVDAGVLERL